MISVRLLGAGSGVPWKELVEMVGADPASVPRLQKRDRICLLLASSLSSPAATILKQCMLSGGADALVHREVITCAAQSSDAVVYGVPSALIRGCDSLSGQPFGLTKLAERIRALLESPDLPRSVTINSKVLFYTEKPLIMGILNTTPDSFSDGGSYSTVDEAVNRALFMAENGADIIDVGGESTRPGSLPVPEKEQIERTVPVIRGIREKSDVPISIDTTLPGVAEAACAAGAGLINSIDAMETPGITCLAAGLKVPVCIMHMKGIPETMQQNPEYGDVAGEVTNYLLKRVKRLCEKGIDRRKIIVDPGIGFGKTLEHNLSLIRSMAAIRMETGCRVLLGHSRKSFLGMLTDVNNPAERDWLTHLVTVLSKDADFVRVHDVRGTSLALKTAKALESFS
ncbi:dihydropteroate synthase [Candidatus Fermentibacteria bacterium]|nr:MAG: dihydropteroate synthase [Candidatus Fermentibacteria bacterium]